MSYNPKDTYFTTRAGVVAVSFGNKILFGMRYYTGLAENQGVAPSAHEFARIMDNDHKTWYMIFSDLRSAKLRAGPGIADSTDRPSAAGNPATRYRFLR